MAKRILVVDDDLDSLDLIGVVLQRRGYDIVTAQSGAQALAKIEAEPPDLIVLDIMMPGMDGYEVSRQLRSNPATANLPVVMFTARTAMQDKVTGFEAGADDYLTKPVQPEELVSRVAAVLRRSERRRAEEGVPTKAQTIGLIGAKGGVGTTTLAVNVAVSLVQGPADGQRVAVAEMRTGTAVASLQLGFSNQGRIKQLLDHPAEEIDADMVAAQLDEHHTGVLLLGGQSEPSGMAMPISPDHAEAIVQHLGNMVDCLLLDLGRGLDNVNRRLLPHCHRVVVTIEPNRMALTLAQPLLKGMTRSLNIPNHRINVVLIKKDHSPNSYAKGMIEGILQHVFVGMVPPAPELAFQASEEGIPMLMLQPDSQVAEQIRTIAAGLLKA